MTEQEYQRIVVMRAILERKVRVAEIARIDRDLKALQADADAARKESR